MAEIANAAFFPAGTLLIGTDGYKAAVTSAVLTPTTPTEIVRDIGGGIIAVSGPPEWTLGLNFMQDKTAPASVNPSLWRHAQLANYGGLFKVTDHIYQIRGQDLSNLTIIETKTGVVFFDVEYSPKALAKSIELPPPKAMMQS